MKKTKTAAHAKRGTTSRAAARLVAPISKSIRLKILRHLQRCKTRGATDQELQEALSLTVSTEVPRRKELESVGLVVSSGLKRPTRSGCSAIVWVHRDFSNWCAGLEPRRISVRERLVEAEKDLEAVRGIAKKYRAVIRRLIAEKRKAKT